MRNYVFVTGAVFALLALVHIARLALEGLQVAADPFFALTTVVAFAFSAWAWHLLRDRRQRIRKY